MPLNALNINFASVMPEIALACITLAILVLDFFLPKENKSLLGYLSIIGLAALIPVSINSISPVSSFGGTVMGDGFAAYFNVIFLISAIFTLLISMDFLRKIDVRLGEYYHITLFATLGMMVMASANDMINFYVGLELMALSFYVLVGIRVADSRSVEGAMKYFVLGALSSGILLYGISFVYGASGSTNFTDIARQIGSTPNTFMIIGIILIVLGFGFKVSAFPFHVWTPDVYEGAPTPVTAFLSVGSKAAAFAVFLRIFIAAFQAFHPQWSTILWMISAATMLFGSVVAISQKNIVRMLAYSTIAHAGIIIMGLLVFSSTGVAGILFYMLVYTFMNIGAFTVAALLIRGDGPGENISDYKGLASRSPLLSLVMALFLLSLAGVPPTGGFAAKFFIFASAIDAQYYWLAAIGVLATAISLFFYARVIFYMFMSPPETNEALPAAGLDYGIVLFLTAAGTLLLGIYPTPFMDMAIKAIKPFFM